MSNKTANILLIEDNPGDARLIRELFAEAGGAMFTLEWVDQLSTGLKCLANGGTDLVLLDLGLPDSQGFDTFTRAYDQAQHLPIVVLTGHNDKMLADRAMRAGAQDYLIKGQIDGNLLIRAVRYAIERKGLKKVLQKSHEELERRVAERISELARVNVELRTEITKHKQAREDLQREKEKFRVLVEESPLGVSLIVKDGDYKYVNPKFVDMFGYTLEEIPTGQEWFKKAYPDKEYRNQVISAWITAVEETKVGQARTLIYTATCKDGSKKVIRFLPVMMEEGDQLVIYEDITEQKKLEAQLIQAQKMEAIGRLAGGVAHDFNNILTVIIGVSELALMKLKQSDPLRQDLEQIKKAGERAASLTHQLLAFSRKQMLQAKVLDLNGVVIDMHNMLNRLIEEDVDLKTILAPELGLVKADPGQIEQVIMNLVVNARDAMPPGGKITIETANVYLNEAYGREHDVKLKPGPYVMLGISDTGIGMDKETKSHIFEPFFTTKEKDSGTGLGLSTVYGIVKQTGGYIWAYSEPGQGTTFKIYLPGVSRKAEPVKRIPTSLKGRRGSETVLLVEDDDWVRKLTKRTLQEHGYQILEAEHGGEALRITEKYEEPIHLLFTDVVMPGMSGRELAERIQSIRPEIKILYMSGYTNNAIIRHGVLTSEVNFIEKPFLPDGLAGKVREVLDK
ncbi:MAG TPA: response regulator [Desulfatiglandales bacterium]|nr:response regulator [Desulfatiglandales bacterium]